MTPGPVVVDTSVLIDHLRGNPAATRHLSDLMASGKMLAASVVSKIEVLAGARPGESTAVAALFALFTWIPVDDEIAQMAGEMAAEFRRSHSGIDLPDYVVAATCRSIGGALSTVNVRHFPMLPGLTRPYG